MSIPPHNYLRKLEQALRASPIPPGQLTVADVEHEADCAFLADPRQVCRCNATITITWVGAT